MTAPSTTSSSLFTFNPATSTVFAKLDWVSLGEKGSSHVDHRGREDSMRMAVKERPSPDPQHPYQPWRVLKIGGPSGIWVRIRATRVAAGDCSESSHLVGM